MCVKRPRLTTVSHQALLDVADVCKKVADCCDLKSNRKLVDVNVEEEEKMLPEVTATRARLEGEM